MALVKKGSSVQPENLLLAVAALACVHDVNIKEIHGTLSFFRASETIRNDQAAGPNSDRF